MNERTGKAKVLAWRWSKLALAIVAFVVVSVLSILASLICTNVLPGQPIMGMAVGQLIGAVFAVLAMIALGGRKWVRISRDGVSHVFRIAWPALIIGVVSIVGVAVEAVSAGSVPDDAALLLVESLLLCAGIGLYEEALFRGVIQGGLLAVMGRTRAGVMMAVVSASLFFGWEHVVGSDLSNPIVLAQVVLKTIEAGMFGFVMGASMLHTRQIGGIALFHALNDFLLMGPSVAFLGDGLDLNYANPDGGIESLIAYGILIAVMIAPTIWAARSILKEQTPCHGALVERRNEKERRRSLQVMPYYYGPVVNGPSYGTVVNDPIYGPIVNDPVYNAVVSDPRDSERIMVQ